MNSRALLYLLLALAAVGPFLGTLGHGFLNWDDPEYIPGNPDLHDGHGLARIWTSFDSPQNYPMVFTTYWLEYHLWGLRPSGYHAVNLILHALAAALLFRFLLRLGIPLVVSFASALLFAVHPTQVASVAWLSERKNVLSAVFYFLCLTEYVEARRGGSRRRLVQSWILGALAMLSKTTTVTIPLTAALIEWWLSGTRPENPHGAPKPGASPGAAGRLTGARPDLPQPDLLQPERLRPDLLRPDLLRPALLRPALMRPALVRLAPLCLPALVLSALTIFREHGPDVVSGVPLLERICAAGVSFWFYAGKLLLPIRLSGVYPRWDPASLVLPGVLSWLGILLMVLLLWKGAGRLPRDVPFGLSQYLLASLPTCGLLSFGYLEKSLVADHFLYLPCWGFWVAFFSLLGALAELIASSPAARTRIVAVAAAAMGLGFTPLTIVYARSWSDSLTFWNRVLARDPRSWLAYGNRGQWYASQGKLFPALSDLQQAIRLRPEYVEAHFNLGYVLERMGRTPEAIEAYEETLRLSPQDPDAHNNLGVLYMRAGNLEDARHEFESVLTLMPEDAGARRNLRRLEALEAKEAEQTKETKETIPR